ncbi:MAG: hypothetical protein K6T83_01045, partial [Alicyclobacillus sp.]|nr:hypothetical protein [Alicyclobacillus sp.]
MPEWTRERVIEAIQRYHREGLSLYLTDTYNRYRPLVQAAKQLFGDWYAAVDAAGLDGSRMREEMRAKLRANNAYVQTPEARRKNAEAHRGKRLTQEHREAISRGWRESAAAKE